LNDIVNSGKEVYSAVFTCLKKMLQVEVPEFLPLFQEIHADKSLEQCLKTLQHHAKMVRDMAEILDDEEDGGENEVDVTLEIAIVICDIFEIMTSKLNASGMEAVETNYFESMENYIPLMRDLCFDSVEEMFGYHHYVNKKVTDVQMSRKLRKRLAAEFSDLPEGLPIHPEASVFFRTSEENIAFCQMLIIPPDDTPYAGGCFIFDVCFPTNYPQGPPLVNLQTTGRGAVRFNPNLYNCGKVCLSLLGTWSGGSQGEKWNPSFSTFFQVALSIQSLIFVPEPYYNEPGYERSMGTEDGDRRSRDYNVVIEKATTQHAILEYLENPPEAWKDVILLHFKLSKERTIRNVTKWMGEDHEKTKRVIELLDNLE